MSDLIREQLLLLGEGEYRDFSSSLLPTLPRDNIIGVRIPKLRKLAKSLYKSGDVSHFLRDLPHKYLEENTLHSLIVCEMSDVSECISELRRFLPYVDNWATCDSLRPRALRDNRDAVLPYVLSLVHSSHTYTARFGIEMLMVNYIGEGFKREFLDTVSGIRGDDYYLRMAVAWYFATALTHRYDETLPYIEGRALDTWVHNKAISKACDSLAIPHERKKYLKTLRIKRRRKMLEAGMMAPDFTLTDKDGRTVSLSDYRGKRVVLYFYPKDNTPGCTRQACAFAGAYSAFRDAGVEVIGISRDSRESHRKFAEKYSLPFVILSDPDRQAIEAYGVWQEKKLYGKVSFGVVRTTFIISPDGVIERVMNKVKPDTNAAQILEALGKM